LREQRIHVEGIDVFPTPTKRQAPDKLLDYTHSLIKEYDLDFKNGDTIWCVFDFDDFEHAISRVIDMNKYKNINMVISNRCFEVWYALHYRYSTGFVSRTSDLESELTRLMGEEYCKNQSYFGKLVERQEVAIKNAKRLEKFHEAQGNRMHMKDANPASDVYKLVEFLNNFQS
jgi:hypothetical protein